MLLVFCHIEKCAGTSLIDKFRTELPFRSCDVISSTNLASRNELRLVQRLYPCIQLISGHNMAPAAFNDVHEVFGRFTSFTVIREPLERLISNYVYDRARGVWTSSLSDYSDIGWKQNYLGKFMGGGDEVVGWSMLDRFDYVIPLPSLEFLLPKMLAASGFEISDVIPRSNVSEKSGAKLPDDVLLVDGVHVGKYKIKPDTYEKLTRLNRIDIDGYADVNGRTTAVLAAEINSNAGVRTGLGNRHVLVSAASAYRNLIYKPLACGKLGPVGLPRNLINPIKAAHLDVFV